MDHTSIAEIVPDFVVLIVERPRVVVDVSNGGSETQVEAKHARTYL